MNRVRQVKRSLFLMLLIHSSAIFAQKSTVKGKVLDGVTGEGLPYANVFVDKTTIGTATNEQGHFLLGNMQLGVTDLVFSYLGYKVITKKVIIGEGENDLGNIELTLKDQQLTDLEVKGTRDEVWENRLKAFKKIFLGTTETAELCSILNPWVIDFEEQGKEVLVKAKEPIQVINGFLGYKINFFLRESNMNNLNYSIQGNILFEEIGSRNPEEALTWAENRNKSYLRSSRHLFKAIINRKIAEEGFRLYEDIRDENAFFEATDNFQQLIIAERVKAKDTAKIVIKDTVPNTFKIVIDKRLEVHYRFAKARVLAYTDIRYPVSWIVARAGYVRVNIDGIPLNANEIITSGDMNQDWIARMLPLNYQPPVVDIKNSKPFGILEDHREHLYIHTDKPYYYPGEPLWFKSYINYSSSELSESLSKVLYVEVINPKRKIIQTKNLLIRQGFAFGDFILPDSLTPGNYYLRAYTTLSRNFGDSTLYVKPFPVLKITDKVDPSLGKQLSSTNDQLSITSDKSEYSTREKIILTIETKDLGSPTSAHLSISVTDAQQVVPIEENENIMSGYPLRGQSLQQGEKLIYPIESGITAAGKVVNTKGKSVSTLINMLDVKSKEMTLLTTDESGKFWVTGLGFYDSAELLFQAKDKKNKPFGRIELSPREIPAFHFSRSNRELRIIPTETTQRIISSYEVPDDTRLLSEIIIKGQKIIEEKDERTYGKPDYVLKAKDINTAYGNLLLTLPGKMPGLIVREINTPNGVETVIYINRLPPGGPATSSQGGGEILVMVNDVPVGGKAAETLAAINPSTIESIEVKTRISGTAVLHGSQGAYGVISIYTKTGPSETIKSNHQKEFQVLRICGYSSGRQFKFPDYSETKEDSTKADYRSTLYWNPEVITDAKKGISTLSFFSSDLTGSYKITVEGVSQNGKTFRGVKFITIKK